MAKIEFEDLSEWAWAIRELPSSIEALYTDQNLTRDLLQNQKRKLYYMSILFFLLLFTFPSGMVLYWTTSNLLQLIQMQIKKALQ